MRFAFGYQPDEELKRSVLRRLDAVREVYFPWGGFTTGRGLAAESGRERLAADLRTYADAGLALDWLLNGNCYGGEAQSRAFFQRVGDQAEYLIETFGLAVVTTASPLIARFLKTNFPALEIRASVNMEIGTPEGVEYLLPWFDSFYLKRECNYDLAALRRMRAYTARHGKKLFLLANSGCLNFCSARTFHDNLVAHQHELARHDNALDFHGLCHRFLDDPAHRAALLAHTNFIRPEDVEAFAPYCDGMKLATRTTRRPAEIVEAYADGRWHGNLWELTEPTHAGRFYPEILDNRALSGAYLEQRWRCDRNCESCGRCASMQQQATRRLPVSV